MKLFLIATICLWATVSCDPSIVDTPFGKVRGRDHGTFYSYHSIPFAKPPVGELRFEPPQPYEGPWEGVLDGTKPAVECLQWSHFLATADQLTGSEDCLTVTIYKPKNESRTSFPIIGNIFGGAWSFGGTAEDGARGFMESGNTIVVKINHRVGILGFASTGDKNWSGNYALKDQRLGVQWIKKYISYFGGDPTAIMLMGFSSGAASVHFQTLHEDMSDLAGIYSLSGNAVSDWSVQPPPVSKTYELAELNGCGRPKDTAVLKACMKKVDAIQLVRTFTHFQLFNYIPFAPFGPNVEPEDAVDPFITKMPADIIKSGKYAQVPWLAGYTQEDGIYNAATFLEKMPHGKERLYDLNTQFYELAPYLFSYRYTLDKRQRDRHSKKIKDKYIGNQNFTIENYYALQRMFTNEIFKNGVEYGVDLQRSYGRAPVYVYLYDNPATSSLGQMLAKRRDIVLGTAHGDDYYTMMDNPVNQPMRADEKLVGWKLVKMLEGFLEGGPLIYDNCTFRNNVGSKQFQLVVIQRTHCYNVEAASLPDAVSFTLPPTPVVIF